jgi:cytoskeletal protein CcmA (bactofilin family)
MLFKCQKQDASNSSLAVVRIAGRIKGAIHAPTVLIFKNAIVTGTIHAQIVLVYGTVDGDIYANSVSLRSTSRVVGEIRHQTLEIEPGAFVQGSFVCAGSTAAKGLRKNHAEHQMDLFSTVRRSPAAA